MLDFGSQVANDPQGGEIWQALQRYQRDLQQFDRSSMQALVRTYKATLPDFQSTIAALDDKIRVAAATGLQPSASWVFQQQRYRALEQQMLSVTGRLAIVTGGEADKQAIRAMASQDKFFASLATGQASFGDTGDLRTWATLPTRTMESFIGLSKGSPLMAKFEADAGKDAMRAVRTTLAGHLATGRPARATARLMADRVAGVTLTRAMTITRTEAARARRAAAIATFQTNPMLRGWVWRCALDTTSCSACIALHGREFPTTEPQKGHPNCRCLMIPMRHKGVNPDIGTGGDHLLNRFRQDGYNLSGVNKILGRSRASEWHREMDRLIDTGMPARLAAQQSLARMATLVPDARYGGMYRPVPLWQLRGGPRPGTGLPPTPQPGRPTGGYNAKPDYDSTIAAEKQFTAGWDPNQGAYGSAAVANKVRAQEEVFTRLNADPAVRDWVRRNTSLRYKSDAEILADASAIDDKLKQEIRSAVDTWAGTSGDSNGRAVAMQVAAQREFGLDAASLKHFGKGEWGPSGYGQFSTYDDWYKATVQPNLDTYLDFDRALLRAQYDITQEGFRQAGITHVTLFRGAGQGSSMGSTWSRIDTSPNPGGSYLANVELQPLSSFSTRPSVASGFGNVFYQTTVPIEYIHSTARTGLGCLGEYEFVVMAAHNAPATLTRTSVIQSRYREFISWEPYRYTVAPTSFDGILESSTPLP